MNEDHDGPMEDAKPWSPAGRFRIGEWTVDATTDEISRRDELVKLEPRKMLLLVTLARRAGEVVTLDQLLEAVWPGMVVTQSSVYQSVAQLRKTLGDNRATPEYIVTVPRKGYRLIASVGPADGGRQISPVATRTLAVGPGPEPAAVHPLVPRADDRVAPIDARPVLLTRRAALLGGASGLAIAAGAGTWWWSRTRASRDGAVRIAVLPFTDQSQGGIEQAAADGLANDVIHRFERSDSILVLARNSAFTFRKLIDERAGLRALKQQLDADYALLGELFRTQQRVRVSVRLLAVPSGREVWTSLFAKPVDRLSELPALIASGALKALGFPDGSPAETNPLGAYELYLLGADAYGKERSTEGLQKARNYFQHAIDTDPTYARAYAGAALTWLQQANYGVGVEAREAAGLAQPLIDKALSLDPALLEGLFAQAHLYMHNNWTDGARARSVMQKAVDLYPGSAEAQFLLGVTYAYDEQPKEAIRYYVKALELDPLNSTIHSRWGQDASFSGDYEAARVHFARAATLAPKYPWRFLGPAQAAYARGQLDDAVSNYRLQFEQEPRRPDSWGELGWLYLDLGLPTQARLAFAKKRELGERTIGADLDETYAVLVEGKDVPTWLSRHGLDQATSGVHEVDRLVVQATAGRRPTTAAIDALRSAMRADAVPWVGSYWIFLGTFAWIDMAMLYVLAGSPAAAVPLLDDAQSMLVRLRERGNAFHTIPYFEARIAALRGKPDVAMSRLTAAVDAGWRRAWLLRFDPAFTGMRDDARVARLVDRVNQDMAVQRSHVGEAVPAPAPKSGP